MNIFGFIFEKKSNLVQKSQNIFRRFKLTLAEGGYSFLKKKSRCLGSLGSNKNVTVALFCVVVQSKPYLWHWKMYFTLILKFCLDCPIETKQDTKICCF